MLRRESCDGAGATASVGALGRRSISAMEKRLMLSEAGDTERSACFWYAWYASKVLNRVWLYMLLASLSSRLCVVEASVCAGICGADDEGCAGSEVASEGMSGKGRPITSIQCLLAKNTTQKNTRKVSTYSADILAHWGNLTLAMGIEILCGAQLKGALGGVSPEQGEEVVIERASC